MTDFTVIRAGTDIYGRPVYMTAFYREWEQARWDNLGFSMPYAQGAYMTRVPGGGAAASSHAHDYAKCVDYSRDHLTDAQDEAAVHEFRSHGGAYYRRGPDPQHGGMPKHGHNTLGADAAGSSMADLLWASYVSGGDGLAAGSGRPAGAPDYEWRPSPLVLTPPPEDDMNADDKQWFSDLIDAKLAAQQSSLVKAIWDAAVDKSGTAARAALRKILERR